MKKLHWLAILMCVVLLVITGFQWYWIRDNYDREKTSLEVKVQSLFRETVREVQDSVLQTRIWRILKDTGKTTVKARPVDGRLTIRRRPDNTARVLRLLREGVISDTQEVKKGMMITLDQELNAEAKEAGTPRRTIGMNGREAGSHVIVKGGRESLDPSEWRSTNVPPPIVRLHADTLQSRATVTTFLFRNADGQQISVSFDSILSDKPSAAVVREAFDKKLDANLLSIPYDVMHDAGTAPGSETVMLPDSVASLGFVDGYGLSLGNTFAYLVRKISLPILFSVFLIGLTVFAFVLLYKSLLRQHRLAVMKSDLISNITHELKTPIATVGVAIEALKSFNAMDDPARTREYLDISQNELQRLGLLVDKVLKLSMFESGKMEIKKEWFALDELVREVIRSLRLQLEKNGARVTVNAPVNLQMQGDRQHIQSVIFNLLDNAIKYNSGKAEITVDINEEQEQIILKVSDNGIGIPPQYRKKIFEKFFRVPSGDTHNAKGHGLGLNYVAKVIDQHGGHITVESNEGTGSSFIINIPKPEPYHVTA